MHSSKIKIWKIFKLKELIKVKRIFYSEIEKNGIQSDTIINFKRILIKNE